VSGIIAYDIDLSNEVSMHARPRRLLLSTIGLLVGCGASPRPSVGGSHPPVVSFADAESTIASSAGPTETSSSVTLAAPVDTSAQGVTTIQQEGRATALVFNGFVMSRPEGTLLCEIYHDINPPTCGIDSIEVSPQAFDTLAEAYPGLVSNEGQERFTSQSFLTRIMGEVVRDPTTGFLVAASVTFLRPSEPSDFPAPITLEGSGELPMFETDANLGIALDELSRQISSDSTIHIHSGSTLDSWIVSSVFPPSDIELAHLRELLPGVIEVRPWSAAAP
jgi:hypothetical protein